MGIFGRKKASKGEETPFPALGVYERFQFPDALTGPKDDPLCWGGNLSPGMLLSAYEQGVFPWYSAGQPILWWSPDPRFVIYTAKVHISDSMRKVLKQNRFDIRYDTSFEAVIRSCASVPRQGQPGTWITEEMIGAYCDLHEKGYAHCVEAWQENRLVGGLYGVAIGRLFCGESMFSFVSNASKTSFLTLAGHLNAMGIPLIDSQVHTPLFESLGAEHIPRATYIEHVSRHAFGDSPLMGDWGKLFSRTETATR